MTSPIRKLFEKEESKSAIFYIALLFFFATCLTFLENLRQHNPLPDRDTASPEIRIQTGDYEGTANFTKNNNKYDQLLSHAAAIYEVDCTLLKAVMLAESQAHPWAKSHRGAVGLMQLLPSTAYNMGYGGNLYNPETNILAGAAYLRHLTTTGCYEKIANKVCDMRDNIDYLLAAYNGGSRANKPAYFSACPDSTAWQCSYFLGYAETRRYVAKVKANYDKLWENDWHCL